jgi:hypothetical protein
MRKSSRCAHHRTASIFPASQRQLKELTGLNMVVQELNLRRKACLARGCGRGVIGGCIPRKIGLNGRLRVKVQSDLQNSGKL